MVEITVGMLLVEIIAIIATMMVLVSGTTVVPTICWRPPRPHLPITPIAHLLSDLANDFVVVMGAFERHLQLRQLLLHAVEFHTYVFAPLLGHLHAIPTIPNHARVPSNTCRLALYNF